MNNYKVKLFYSYSHTDEPYRIEMEKSLALLKEEGILDEWNDRKILAGQHINRQINNELGKSNIVVFLISPDFLNSAACKAEWVAAKSMTTNNNKVLISVIVRDCSWEDFDNMKDYLALPTDANPINKWDDKDTAWKSVYEGIKDVVNRIRETYELKEKYREKIILLEFCSQSKEEIFLEDLFVFPRLISYVGNTEKEGVLDTTDNLISKKYVIIGGDNQSGRTKLCSYLFLDLADKKKPVILIDLDDIKSKKPTADIFEQYYSEQFCGDYNLWNKQQDKTVIFDNLSHDGNSLEHVMFSKDYFDNIVVTTSTDEYMAYFRDETKLTDYLTIKIEPFTHSKQEQLIKKWLNIKNIHNENNQIEHGQIDQIENKINAIIINNKIIPRYPFFILSILQTFEVFMPQDIRITAYGHCYYALILAHLIKSGVDKQDEAIGSCFNFASHLAFEIYNKNPDYLSISKIDYENFKVKYQNNYIMKDSLINRLCGVHGILRENQDGTYCFNMAYSYYFFLGQYLAKNFKDNSFIINRMVEKSYVRNNALVLIFTIHHAQDIEIIDEILLHTLCTVDNVEPAKLDKHEALVFNELLSIIPQRILSDQLIEQERSRERDIRDQCESMKHEDTKETHHDFLNQVYKSQKNIEILSQILKNKYGSLEKSKIEEIIETICDAGLRLVKIFLGNEYEIDELVQYIQKKYEESDDYDKNKGKTQQMKDIRKMVKVVIFMWTMMNIEKIVSSINKPEIKYIIKKIRDKKNTPSYDMIHYFYSIDAAQKIGNTQISDLEEIISKHNKKDMFFLHRILSLRTQHYINTHRIHAPIKQKICSLLGI